MSTNHKSSSQISRVDTSTVFPVARNIAASIVAAAVIAAVWYGSHQVAEAPAPENRVVQVAPAPVALTPQ